MSAIAAADNGGMTIQHVSSRCTALIKSEEGYQARRYLCPAGKPTIGYGHVILPHENFPQPMTKAAAEALLLRDLAPVENYLSATFPGINQHQFDALACFAFNVGVGALDHSTLKRRLLAGDVAGAADEFKRWVHAGKTVLPGLIKRRAAERELFLTPEAT